MKHHTPARLCAALLALCFAAAPAFAARVSPDLAQVKAYGGCVQVKTEGAALRAAPRADAQQLASMPEGALLCPATPDGEWFKVAEIDRGDGLAYIHLLYKGAPDAYVHKNDVTAVSAQAQQSSQQALQLSPQQEYIKQVRAAYAEAQATIAQGQGEPQAKNEATLQATYMRPGAGQTQHKVELFFRMVDTDEPGHVRRQLYLARESFNVAALTFYREYLYDNAGAPLFLHTRHDTYDKGRVEQRYYYRGGKVAAAEPEGGDGAAYLPQFERMKTLLQNAIALQSDD